MGLNENITYNIMKETGPLQGGTHKAGVHKGKSSGALPEEAPGKKNKHTKHNSRFQKQNKTRNLEAQINLVEGSM